MKMKDHLSNKTMNKLDSMRKAPIDDETEEEKKYREEKEWKKLMGMDRQILHKKNGKWKR